MKKRLEDISLEKDGWKLTPSSISTVNDRKTKIALNTAIVGIQRELQANNNIISGIKDKLIDNLGKFKGESNTEEIKGIAEIIKRNNVLLGESIRSITELLKKDANREWNFEIRRNRDGTIGEVIARQI